MTADRATRICATAVPGAQWRATEVCPSPTRTPFALRATFPDNRTAVIFTEPMSLTPFAYLSECLEIARLATTLAECWVDGKVRA